MPGTKDQLVSQVKAAAKAANAPPFVFEEPDSIPDRFLGTEDLEIGPHEWDAFVRTIPFLRCFFPRPHQDDLDPSSPVFSGHGPGKMHAAA